MHEESSRNIEGVIVKRLVRHCDERGYLLEVLRDDDGLLERFGQTTFTIAYPGVIKAFHWHRKQHDLWFMAMGEAIAHLSWLRHQGRVRRWLDDDGRYRFQVTPAATTDRETGEAPMSGPLPSPADRPRGSSDTTGTGRPSKPRAPDDRGIFEIPEQVDERIAQLFGISQ